MRSNSSSICPGHSNNSNCFSHLSRRERLRSSINMLILYYLLGMFLFISILYSVQFILFFDPKPTNASEDNTHDNIPNWMTQSLTISNMSLLNDSHGSLQVWPGFLKDRLNKVSVKSISSLYAKSNYIMEVSDREVTSLLANIKDHYPVCILYYASWCGHCQHFVKTYNEMAAIITTQLKIPIILAAMDCVQYQSACSEAGVRAYPTAKAYNIPSDPESIKGFGSTVSPPYQIKTYVIKHSSAIVALFQDQVKLTERLTNTKNKTFGYGKLLKVIPNKSLISKVNTSVALETPNEIAVGIQSAAWTAIPQERLEDAMTSLLYLLAIESEVHLTTNKLQAMKNFLSVFLQIPRLRTSNPSSFVEKYYGQLDNFYHLLNTTSENDIISTYPVLAVPMLLGQLEPSFYWSVCGSKKDGVEKSQTDEIRGGYTCGIWMLFHYMTVAPSYTSDSKSRIKTSDIMESIRTLVSELFGCKHCREHFLYAYDECLYQRCRSDLVRSSYNYNALQLWLWKFHNAVNIRIFQSKQEHSRIRDIEDALWPSIDECKPCWSKPSSLLSLSFFRRESSAHIYDNEPTMYNEDAIQSYLQTAYWK